MCGDSIGIISRQHEEFSFATCPSRCLALVEATVVSEVKMLVGSRMSSANTEVDPVTAPGACGAAVDTTRGVLANETSGGFHPYHLLSLDHDHSSWKKEDHRHLFSGKAADCVKDSDLVC